MLTRQFLLAVLLTLPLAAYAADEKPPAKLDTAAVRKLVEQLASEDFDTREKATQELSRLEQVPDELRAATKSADAEVRRRAREAVKAITARADAKEVEAMVADVQQTGLDRFVRRMVTEADFAGDKQWEVVQKLTRLVVARANELGDREFAIPELDMKSLPQQAGTGGNLGIRGKRVLLSDPKAPLLDAVGCVILSAGPMTRPNYLSKCVVIVDGDLPGVTEVDRCVLIVRGNVGAITEAHRSIILATGELKGSNTTWDSFYQVSNTKLTFTESRHNVYIKSTLNATSSERDRTLDTDRGPLQVIRFSEAKKDKTPKAEKR
jgi:hypothetical protein